MADLFRAYWLPAAEAFEDAEIESIGGVVSAFRSFSNHGDVVPAWVVHEAGKAFYAAVSQSDVGVAVAAASSRVEAIVEVENPKALASQKLAEPAPEGIVALIGI
jgi:exosome complex RNA-binding protein Csl4